MNLCAGAGSGPAASSSTDLASPQKRRKYPVFGEPLPSPTPIKSSHAQPQTSAPGYQPLSASQAPPQYTEGASVTGAPVSLIPGTDLFHFGGGSGAPLQGLFAPPISNASTSTPSTVVPVFTGAPSNVAPSSPEHRSPVNAPSPASGKGKAPAKSRVSKKAKLTASRAQPADVTSEHDEVEIIQPAVATSSRPILPMPNIPPNYQPAVLSPLHVTFTQAPTVPSQQSEFDDIAHIFDDNATLSSPSTHEPSPPPATQPPPGRATRRSNR